MLNLRGKTNVCLAVDPEKGELNEVEQFDWSNALIDGVILSVLAFFTALSVDNLFGADVFHSLVTAAIGAAIQFFTILAIKRGIREN